MKHKHKRRASFFDFPDGEKKFDRFMEATKVSKRDYALFMLLTKTAIRGVSAMNARWQDVGELEGQAVLWIYGKTISEDRKKWKLLKPEVARAINEWYDECKPKESDRIFPISIRMVRYLFDKYKAAAGITDPVTVHSLRHTAITKALLKGVPLPAVQALADHANVTTTARYAHAVRRIKDAAEEVL